MRLSESISQLGVLRKSGEPHLEAVNGRGVTTSPFALKGRIRIGD